MCKRYSERRCSDMHLILRSSPLCLAWMIVICLNSSITQSSEMGHVKGLSASGEGLQSAAGEEIESDDIVSGLFTYPPLILAQPGSQTEEGRPRGGRRKHGGKKRNKPQVTVGHKSHTIEHGQHSYSTTTNPCLTSHRDYCIHGHCTYLQDLKEPVCVCLKGYDGVRCGIHLLQTSSEGLDKHNSETLQITIVIIVFVLSVVSFSAILLMICVHYKTQQTIQDSFLSSNSESEKLQKNIIV